MPSSDKQIALNHALKMRDAIQSQLLDGAGIVSVNTDGVSVTFSRDQALKELSFWEKRIRRLRRAMGGVSTIRLDNAQDNNVD